jgi:hypothetical protein
MPNALKSICCILLLFTTKKAAQLNPDGFIALKLKPVAGRIRSVTDVRLGYG